MIMDVLLGVIKIQCEGFDSKFFLKDHVSYYKLFEVQTKHGILSITTLITKWLYVCI